MWHSCWILNVFRNESTIAITKTVSDFTTLTLSFNLVTLIGILIHKYLTIRNREASNFLYNGASKVV